MSTQRLSVVIFSDIPGSQMGGERTMTLCRDHKLGMSSVEGVQFDEQGSKAVIAITIFGMA
jgi:hypothetical protein